MFFLFLLLECFDSVDGVPWRITWSPRLSSFVGQVLMVLPALEKRTSVF